MFPRREKSSESKQNRLATEGGRSSTEREPKRTETEQNGSQRGAKQNRMETKVKYLVSLALWHLGFMPKGGDL